jgi:hypothetical protein
MRGATVAGLELYADAIVARWRTDAAMRPDLRLSDDAFGPYEPCLAGWENVVQRTGGIRGRTIFAGRPSPRARVTVNDRGNAIVFEPEVTSGPPSAFCSPRVLRMQSERFAGFSTTLLEVDDESVVLHWHLVRRLSQRDDAPTLSLTTRHGSIREEQRGTLRTSGAVLGSSYFGAAPSDVAGGCALTFENVDAPSIPLPLAVGMASADARC